MSKYSSLDTDEDLLTKSFLESESDDEIQNLNKGLKSRHQSWIRRHSSLVAWNSMIFVLNIAFCLAFAGWTFRTYSHGPQHAQSPARDVIKYESRRFDTAAVFQHDGNLNPNKTTNFNGYPRKDLDEAWAKLTSYQNIRIKQEELGQFARDDSLIALSDGSGYFASTAVFHGLHCIKRLHHFIYRETYYADITDDEARRLKHHTEHCLDWLRQYVQCNADTTIMPLHWGPNEAIPLARDEGFHQCVNWDDLNHWMEKRSIDVFEPGLIVHPLHGSPYGDEKKGDKIGIV